MEAIILAGGKGTRLKSVVSNIPKPMAPVNNKPFLEYILTYLEDKGFLKVVLSVGYKWNDIKKYFGESYKGMELSYSVETNPLGTGGAIKKALGKTSDNYVFIINGDTFFDIDLIELQKQFNLSIESKLVLSLKKMHNINRYGVVETDKQGYVTEFKEKEIRKTGCINGGVYLAKRNIFDNYQLPEVFSFENFMMKELKTLKIGTRIFDNYFIDIGIPEDYIKVQSEIEKYI